MTGNGRRCLRRTAAGLELCCRWKDGTTSYQPFSLLKESYPAQIAEFAVAMGIEDDPAFNWWVKPVLKRRERIVSAANKRQARYFVRCFKLLCCVLHGGDDLRRHIFSYSRGSCLHEFQVLCCVLHSDDLRRYNFSSERGLCLWLDRGHTWKSGPYI